MTPIIERDAHQEHRTDPVTEILESVVDLPDDSQDAAAFIGMVRFLSTYPEWCEIFADALKTLGGAKVQTVLQEAQRDQVAPEKDSEAAGTP